MAVTLILLSIALPWLGALAVWLIGDSRPRLQHGLAVSFSVLGALAALGLLPFSTASEVIRLSLGGVFGDFTFIPDGLGIFLAIIATVVGCLAVIFSVDYMHNQQQLGRYYAFVLFFIGAMVGLVLTGSLLLAFIFWEITALCSYALIAFYNDDPKAVAGGIKALIMTQIGGIGLLCGALISYSYFGSYQISDLLARYAELPAGLLSFIAFGFLVAAAAKSAQFPFQTWLPDAMEAPTPVSALIHAATMVNAGVYLLARFYPAFAEVPGWRIAVVIVGAVSALLAAIMALVATDLKRVLAYSTVSQLGYMVYAIGAGGVFASQFHLLSHSIFKALLFLGAGAVIHTAGTRNMLQMGGLGQKMPVVRNTFIIGALALAGIPFLNGFWSKELILEAGLSHGPLWGYWIMLLVAGLTSLYTLRCVSLVFFGQPRSSLHFHDAPPAMRISLLILALGTLTTWLLAGPFIRLLKTTLPFHLLEAHSTAQILTEVLTAPATLVALGVITFGILLWIIRKQLQPAARALRWLSKAASHSFGFESINQGIVSITNQAAEALRSTQTGILSWNVAGILLGLIILLAIFIVGVYL